MTEHEGSHTSTAAAMGRMLPAQLVPGAAGQARHLLGPGSEGGSFPVTSERSVQGELLPLRAAQALTVGRFAVLGSIGSWCCSAGPRTRCAGRRQHPSPLNTQQACVKSAFYNVCF